MLSLTKKTISVLLIEDEEFDAQRIRKTINPFKESIVIKDVVSNGRAALDILEENYEKYDVIIMDYQIAGGIMGERLIQRIKAIDSTLQIIVVTKMTINMTDYDFANKLIEAGASWYCTKYPGDIEDFIYQPTDFILNIFNAYERKKLEQSKLKSNQKLKQNIQDVLIKKRLMGNSSAIQMLHKQISQYAETDTNVLITGASGTGKELVATNIHYNSKRKYENFVPINCGSLPENLIESELFGFEKGAFTGASVGKPGLFEVANNGTIFLDEITELPMQTQSTLLRVIQEGEIDKIGRTKKVKVNVRIIAASNKNLKEEIQKKLFREDLYYRLNVVSISIPPLRSRRDDISVLINHFMDYFSRDMSRNVPEISKSAMDKLVQYDWPGNVRELQNIVQRLILSGENELTDNNVNLALGVTQDFGSQPDFALQSFGVENDILPWREVENKIKRDYFQYVRENTSSDAEAARKLGLAPPNFHRMCKELGMK